MIARPVTVEDWGVLGLVLIGADNELILSSLDVTAEELEEIATVLNLTKEK